MFASYSHSRVGSKRYLSNHMDKQAYQALFVHMRKFVPLTADEERYIATHLQVQRLRKKDIIHRQGDVCTSNYFVADGLMRMFGLTEEGKEQIVQFAIENWWITDYMSLEGKTTSVFTIQAVEDSTVISLEQTSLATLYDEVPPFERYMRRILQRAYSASLMRLMFIFNESGEERYRNFVRQFPDFVQRVPQYMLASYMGVTPEFLSKVRGKKE
jgi:CRP/FNR family transcriptional regulator